MFKFAAINSIAHPCEITHMCVIAHIYAITHLCAITDKRFHTVQFIWTTIHVLFVQNCLCVVAYYMTTSSRGTNMTIDVKNSPFCAKLHNI